MMSEVVQSWNDPGLNLHSSYMQHNAINLR